MNTKSEKDIVKSLYIKIFILATVVTLIFVIIIGHGIKKDRNSKSYTYTQCYYYSQTLVKAKLKSPKSADFPRYSDKFIKDNGDTIVVSAYVDADNSFGANVRVNYTAKIKIKNGKPESGNVTVIE